MKVAISVHQGRIAPVFDCCRRLLIIQQAADDDEIVGNEDWSELRRHIRALRLKEIGVEALICGGISRWMQEQVELQGIKILPWLAGDIQDVLNAFRENRISDPCFRMPGAGGCRRRTERQRRRTQGP